MQDKSGMNFHFRIWMDDGSELDFETKPIDVIRWEDKFNKKFSDGQGSGQMIMWIAYSAAFRQKLTTESTFDAWASKVVDWDRVTDDDDQAEAGPNADPTPADTQMGPSENE